MKKITLVLIIFLMFAGVVTASSINGDYKGKPIIKMKSNGKVLIVEDAPAVLMDSRTMVPIYMLKQIGLGVEWNAEEYSVDVTLPKVKDVEPVEQGLSIPELTKEMQSYNVGYVEYVSNGDGFNQLTFYYDLDILDDGSRTTQLNIDYNEMLSRSVVSDVTSTRIYDIYGTTITVLTDYVRDFISFKMTPEEFQDKLNIKYAETNEVSNQQQTQTTISSYPELYSNDGKTYLGKLTTNEFDSDSVFNKFGDYGSKFSSDSIWNDFGDYGSEFSSESAFNDLASDPPIILQNGEVIGHLTTNDTINDAVSPIGLKQWLKDLGY